MSAVISMISGHGLSIDIHCGIKVFHVLTAGCQYVSYFDRWTNDWLCFYFPFLYVCSLCCKDVPSFDSSLLISVIFCQVDKRLALFLFSVFVCMSLVL